MKRNVLILLALGAVAGANAQSLWNNALAGSWDNTGVATGTRAAGGRLSVLDTAAGLNVFGFGANGNNNTARVADDFTVGGGGWNLQSGTFWAYQTGATTVSLTGGTFNIVTGSDPNTGTLVGSGTYGGASFTDIYRVTDTNQTDSTRRLQQVSVNFGNLNLAPGTYTLVWSFTGSLASGPWQVPLTKLGTPVTGNAWQSLSGGAFNPLIDTGTAQAAQGLPFWLDGQVVPEPGTMIAMGVGLAALAARRRRK